LGTQDDNIEEMDDAAACAAQRARRFPSAAGATLIFCLALSCFVQGDFRTEDDRGGKTKEYHALLASGFLAGRTSLPLDPAPELLALKNPYDSAANGRYRLHDASLYGGKYYLYFGPAPALLFFLPYRVVTGRDLHNAVAVPLLCAAGYLCACALLYLLAGHNGWSLPLWLELCAVSLLGTSSFVFFLITRALFYEVSIAAGYLFLQAAFLCLFLALRSAQTRAAWLAASGLLFGLAFGSRPNLALAGGAAGVAVAYYFRGRWRLTLIFGAGIFLCAAGLAWFNYIRFGNPFEFGQRYQLNAFAINGPRLSLSEVLPTLRIYFFTPLVVGSGFPFLRPSLLVSDPLFPWFREPFVGILPTAPMLLLGIVAPVFLKLRNAGGTVVFRAMHAAAVLLLLFVAFLGWAAGRYLVDFAPLLAFCGVLALRALWGPMDTRGAAVCRAIAGTLCAYSLLVLTVLSAPSAARLVRYFSNL
jgi:hypothetical protein